MVTHSPQPAPPRQAKLGYDSFPLLTGSKEHAFRPSLWGPGAPWFFKLHHLWLAHAPPSAKGNSVPLWVSSFQLIILSLVPENTVSGGYAPESEIRSCILWSETSGDFWGFSEELETREVKCSLKWSSLGIPAKAGALRASSSQATGPVASRAGYNRQSARPEESSDRGSELVLLPLAWLPSSLPHHHVPLTLKIFNDFLLPST